MSRDQLAAAKRNGGFLDQNQADVSSHHKRIRIAQVQNMPARITELMTRAPEFKLTGDIHPEYIKMN